MNPFNIIKLSDQESSLTINNYLPLVQKKTFKNFKQRLLVQLSVESCKLMQNKKYKTTTIILCDEKLNDLILAPLEEAMKTMYNFKSVIREDNEVFVKLTPETLIDKDDEDITLDEIDKILINATLLITVNFYTMGTSCGLSLKCERIKYLSGLSSNIPDFI